MYKSLDHAISRFESEDLTSIVVRSLASDFRVSVPNSAKFAFFFCYPTPTNIILSPTGAGVAAGDQQTDSPLAVQAHDAGQLRRHVPRG